MCMVSYSWPFRWWMLEVESWVAVDIKLVGLGIHIIFEVILSSLICVFCTTLTSLLSGSVCCASSSRGGDHVGASCRNDSKSENDENEIESDPANENTNPGSAETFLGVKLSSYLNISLLHWLSTWSGLSRPVPLTHFHVDPPSVEIQPLHLISCDLGVSFPFVLRKTISPWLLGLSSETTRTRLRFIHDVAVLKLS